MDYMGAIIWQKTTTMNTSGGGAVMGSFPYPRNGILKLDYEFILIFKKLGNAPKPTAEQKKNSILTKAEWNEYFSSHWNFNGVKQNEHIAMFPEELPKRLIKMFSFEGETVFDPFLGSGTTSLAAMKLKRNSVGYEINKTFSPIIEDKLLNNPYRLESQVDFISDHNNNFDYSSLPYKFEDPHKLDKKIDIKKLQFGSKLDSNEARRDDLFAVKEVLSANKILLGNGQTIKLLGVKINSETNLKAVEFLKMKFNKRKVFLKYDNVKYDNENNLLCYVYLDNKTFINRHLIKTKLVYVDTTLDYRYKNKFLEDFFGTAD
jgi:site-specific DNA-methyltransferase (adenine-specific)